MKPTLLVLLLCVFLMLSITACKKMGCTDVMAMNYNSAAVKDNGKCLYAYQPYLGTYNMSDTLYTLVDTVLKQSQVTIEKVLTSGMQIKITLQNGVELVADLDANSDTFVIPEQAGGGTRYYGSGSRNNNTLHLHYYFFKGDNYVFSSGQKQ